MEIGETVEFIRHSKNISIKQVCGDYLTRQTYYRFIKNNLDISSKKLLYILDNLNVNVDEFLFILVITLNNTKNLLIWIRQNIILNAET